jgi:hypothetical protein
MKRRPFFNRLAGIAAESKRCKIVLGIQILCGLIFADTIYMKNGDTRENVTLAEITQTDVKYKVGERTVLYTVSKDDVSRVVYNDGSEDVFETQTQVRAVETQPQEQNDIYSPVSDTGKDATAYTYMVRFDRLSRLLTQIIDKGEYQDTVLKIVIDYGILVPGRVIHYDTVGVSSFRHHGGAFGRNYKVSAGYSGVLGFNAFATIDFMDRCRLFREETLISDYIRFAEFGIGWVENGYFAIFLGFKRPLWESNDFDVLWGYDMLFSPLGGFETAGNIGFLYKQWLFSTGLSLYIEKHGGRVGLAPSLNMAYFIKEIKKSEFHYSDVIKRKKSDKPRYFRPGIELNYPVYRSEIEFFNNEFPYPTGSAGLFFRVGSDNIYFTTGAYAKFDYLYRDSVVSAQLNGPFGINIARLPLLDIGWSKFSVEVPALLNFGAGQIRFSGGVLFDFYAVSELNIRVSESVPWIGGQPVINENDADRLEERFDEAPTGNMYAAIGLDFDIVKYWGIGVKLLILTNSFGETDSYKGFNPSALQTRISTYFVF